MSRVDRVTHPREREREERGCGTEDGGVGRHRTALSAGADIKANAFGAGGALERGHGAPLEPLAQLGDALGGVGATALPVEAAELVFAQAAMSGARMVREEFMIDRVTHCQRALT